MRYTIVQGLERVYYNLGHMIAEFLPRLVVMLVVFMVGLVVALVFKYILRALLRLTRLDRVSEDAGASRVLRMAHLPPMSELLSRSFFWVTWFAFILVGLSVLDIASLQEQISRLAAISAGSVRRHFHFLSGRRVGEFPLTSRAACRGECGLGLCANSELVYSLHDLDSRGDHDPRGTWRGPANRHCGVFHRVWCAHAGLGHFFWPRRSGPGAAIPGKIFEGFQPRERQGAPTLVILRRR